MWVYEKKLQYPVKIKNPNPQMAQVIMSQLGGANPQTLYSPKTPKSRSSRTQRSERSGLFSHPHIRFTYAGLMLIHPAPLLSLPHVPPSFAFAVSVIVNT